MNRPCCSGLGRSQHENIMSFPAQTVNLIVVSFSAAGKPEQTERTPGGVPRLYVLTLVKFAPLGYLEPFATV
jgi:hypothetical protein